MQTIRAKLLKRFFYGVSADQLILGVEGGLILAYTGWLSLRLVQAKVKSLNLPSAAEEGLGELCGSTESYCCGIYGACCYESISHHNYLICPFFKLDNKVQHLTRSSFIHLHFLLSFGVEGSPSSINQQALG